MSKKIALLFPGQGAQFPGMGKDFYDAFSQVRETMQEADEYLQTSFSKLLFESSVEELSQTKNSQVAIYILGVALSRLLFSQSKDLRIDTCSGLSLGEYTALTAAGKLSFKEGIALVKLRAESMQRACEKNPGSMQVVLGLSELDVQEVLSEFNPPHPVWIANLNCPGQIVIAGSLAALSLVAEPLKKRGAKRCLPLDVSGAFHSGLMLPAQEELGKKIEITSFQSSGCRMVMNVTGGYVDEVTEIKRALLQQLTSPVRWQKGIESMIHEGMDLYIEMAPGKTLSGMNKRIGVQAPTYSLEKVEDLETVLKI